jgi:hypothetical protein
MSSSREKRSAPEFEHLLRRVREHGPSDFFVSIITFHEQVMGWNAYISRARDSAGVVRGYERFQSVLEFLRSPRFRSMSWRPVSSTACEAEVRVGADGFADRVDRPP